MASIAQLLPLEEQYTVIGKFYPLCVTDWLVMMLVTVQQIYCNNIKQAFHTKDNSCVIGQERCAARLELDPRTCCSQDKNSTDSAARPDNHSLPLILNKLVLVFTQ